MQFQAREYVLLCVAIMGMIINLKLRTKAVAPLTPPFPMLILILGFEIEGKGRGWGLMTFGPRFMSLGTKD